MSKEQQVEAMFNGIASRYDFLNHLLSFGIDKIWRRRLIKRLLKNKPINVLDVATGTGDLAIALAKKESNIKVTGIDIAQNMLLVGKKKVETAGLRKRISLCKGSSEKLPFEKDNFDAAMVAFGVRNFENPLKGLKEIFRVVKNNGSLFVLEFTSPKNWLFKFIYRVYFLRVLPWIGRKVSGHKTAYSYLPNSVQEFAEREKFLELLVEAGFQDARYSLQTFGIAAIYQANKPAKSL
ncbi:MAG: bifunctional demethylmenaquinone methyltransferase/2-methoxy-6-polyprenyl-1,4-benzoquinol methylase UbiE [Bacteroidales bacterium]